MPTNPTDPLETAPRVLVVENSIEHVRALESELARVRAELDEARTDYANECNRSRLERARADRDIATSEIDLREANRRLETERDLRAIDSAGMKADLENTERSIRSLIATIDRDNGERQEGETVAQSCERAGHVVAELSRDVERLRARCGEHYSRAVLADQLVDMARDDMKAIHLALGNPSATVEEICARLRETESLRREVAKLKALVSYPCECGEELFVLSECKEGDVKTCLECGETCQIVWDAETPPQVNVCDEETIKAKNEANR